MRDLPPLNALRAFEAAARHGSFQVAAEELHVSPTAVSHHIRYLEDLLGQKLFRRQPRPIRLTPAGRILFPALRDGLDRIGAGVASVRAPGSVGPLVITTTPAFASRWLVPCLDELSKATGGPVALLASEKVADLHAGDADLAIRYTRSPPDDLLCRHLFDDRYLPVCHPRLLDECPPKRVLVEHPLIHFEWKRDDPDAPRWERWLASARQECPELALPDAESGIHLSEEFHAIEAAILGQGVALLSDKIVARELETRLLVPALDFAIPGLGFYAMYPGDSPRRDIVEHLVDHLLRRYT